MKLNVPDRRVKSGTNFGEINKNIVPKIYVKN
jgi:hypothetical protein